MGKDRLTKKDIYNRLYEGKDFEIEHLWQRSVFLGAFLILFFTVYFTVLGSVLSEVKASSISQSIISAESTMVGTALIVSEKEESVNMNAMEYLYNNKGTNAVLLVIALLGASFSLLWIFMAKGSKFWYEKYERSIDEMQKDENIFDNGINKEKRIEEAKAKLEHREEHHIPIHGHMPSKSNIDSVFSHKGGAYSLSSINVSIGHIFCWFWFFVCAFHITLQFPLKLEGWLFWVVFIIMAVVLFVLLTLCIGNSNRSGEANWSNFFRVFWSRRELKEMLKSKVLTKRKEITSFSELINEAHLRAISTRIQSDDISPNDSNWNKVRKYLENKETRGYFLSYCEEYVFSTMMPEALPGKWTARTGRNLIFDQKGIVDEKEYLMMAGCFYSSCMMNSPKYKTFTSVPWALLGNKKSLKDRIAKAVDWQIYCILSDDIGNVICYEKFDFHHRADRECLNSVLVNFDGDKLYEYVWWKN